MKFEFEKSNEVTDWSIKGDGAAFVVSNVEPYRRSNFWSKVLLELCVEGGYAPIDAEAYLEKEYGIKFLKNDTLIGQGIVGIEIPDEMITLFMLRFG